MKVPPKLRWALLLALAIGAWASFTLFHEGARSPPSVTVSSSPSGRLTSMEPAPLAPPAMLPVAVMPPAEYDPFVGPMARASTPRLPPYQPAPAMVATTALTPVVPAPAVEPPMEHILLGRVTAPDGSSIVLLRRGEDVVVASQGITLDSGYVIERVDASAINLLHPALQVRRIIALASP